MKQLTFLIACLLTINSLFAQEQVIVPARDYAREKMPVYVRLSKPHAVKGSWQLTDVKTGRSVPAQFYDSVTLVFIPAEKIAGGTAPAYTLKRGTASTQAASIKKQSNGLLVSVKERPLFFYHTAVAEPPAGSPGYYRRSGFIHPIYSPGGNILTDDFPAGHMHQHGIFMTWVNTTFRNKPLDFWNQHSQTGTVQHMKLVDVQEGPVFSRIRTRLQHVSLVHGPVLEEIWTITIYPFSDHFLFDLESEQVNITTDTLYLNKYHYGGLAVRGSRQWNKHDSLHFKNDWKILTSEGKDNASANHTHARWVDASGKINDTLCGLTVLGHPGNFRYPQAIRLHPDMPYWCFAPVVDGAFALDPGKRYRSAFRFLVHNGSADTNAIEQAALNFGDLPFKSGY